VINEHLRQQHISQHQRRDSPTTHQHRTISPSTNQATIISKRGARAQGKIRLAQPKHKRYLNRKRAEQARKFGEFYLIFDDFEW
jgi:hypothetical protein